MIQLTKRRFFLAARGVQLDNGVTPPPLCDVDTYKTIYVVYDLYVQSSFLSQKFGIKVLFYFISK